LPIADYCREIESYLCQKNDGHLIRVVGPSFEIVSGWAAAGVPLKVARRGIDRYFERYYAKGPRRRPVKIDFCEADVKDVFDEWRRALGLTAAPADAGSEAAGADAVASRDTRAGHHSLPAHLERVVLRLSSARATGLLGAGFDALIDRLAVELDGARARSGGLRGPARQELIDRLAVIDGELMHQASATLDDAARRALAGEADDELAGFRAAMAPEAFARARAAAIDRLVRERFGVPTVRFE
jgi:hypothetical protein